MNHLVTLGRNIAAYRVRHGLKQHELGALVGTSGGCISAYERGKTRRPDFPLLEKIAEAFGITVRDLFMDFADGYTLTDSNPTVSGQVADAKNIAELVGEEEPKPVKPKPVKVKPKVTSELMKFEYRVRIGPEEFLIVSTKDISEGPEAGPQYSRYETDFFHADGTKVTSANFINTLHEVLQELKEKNRKRRAEIAVLKNESWTQKLDAAARS